MECDGELRRGSRGMDVRGWMVEKLRGGVTGGGRSCGGRVSEEGSRGRDSIGSEGK